jgi:hypothetical protein
MFDKKDLELINSIFETLSKAKWDGLDGDAIIKIHNSFVGLRKLEEKVKQSMAGDKTPASLPTQEKPSKKKKVE